MSDPYQRLSKRELYRNPWLALEVHDIVHPTGARGEHALVVTPAAAAVLVVEGDALVFARQARFGARSVQVEIVKGGADEGETALACAQRELREELGIEARVWEPLGITYEVPSIMSHPVTLFLAREIAHTATDQEDVERIDAVRLAIDDAYAACIDGRIDDAVTLAALLRYRLSLEAASTDSRDTRVPRAPR